jgi:hypothetical protein
LRHESLHVKNEHLAKGVPALSPAIGRTMLGTLPNPTQRNFDMNNVFKPDAGISWPRNSGDYADQWCHSDMKDVAFFYTHKLFKRLVDEGILK